MKTIVNYLLVVLLFCLANTTGAQNLVVNPSFEITNSNCANLGGEGFFTDLIGSWDNTNSVINGDSCTSPDLFSACNHSAPPPPPLDTIPCNSCNPTYMPSSPLGYQYSHTGTRHVGIILYENSDEYREYIQGRLATALLPGKEYTVSMYVSLADKMPYAVNNLGVYFSNTHYLHNACANSSASAILVTPQLNNSTGVITDTSSAWFKLTWNYIATGGEQYFVIGNFFDNAHTVILPTGQSPFSFQFAYYFIDDVSVKLAYTCSDSIVIGNIVHPGCAISNGSLSATVLALPTDTLPYIYVWNTGDSIQNLTGVASGIYSVTASNNAGCEITKSFVLNNAFADSVSLSIADANCSQNNGSISVDISSSINRNYNWNTGATTQSITSLAKGTYSVTVSFANGCVVVDSAIVGGPIISIFAAANGICPGDSVQLCASAGYSIYLWSNGATSTCISVTQAGSYHVSLTDNSGCMEVSEEIQIALFQAPVVTAVISGSQIMAVTNGSSGALTYQWYSDSGAIGGVTYPNYFPVQNGNYWVEVTNSEGCRSFSNVVHYAVGCRAQFVLFPDSLTVHNWFSQVFTTGAQPITYNWQWGDGTNSTGLNSHSYAAPGNYNICLSITDANGCTDTYCDSSTYLNKTESDMVTVNPVLELPNAVAEVKDDIAASVYPNPATNLLYIKAAALKVNVVYIYNVTGSLVKMISQLNAGEGVDISLLPAGVYVADIITKDASIRKRWVKI
jgi:hypothetical protein